MKLFLVKHVLFVIYRTAPFVVIGEKMKMDHDTPNNHVGKGARKMNEEADRKKNRPGAGYLAAMFGFGTLCEYTHPATYGGGIPRVM
jgi:hypothetical protein